MIDIDHFKRINDQHGHAAGDEVLRRVAREALSAMRVADVLARWGGDEFVLLLSDASAAVGARRRRAPAPTHRGAVAAGRRAGPARHGVGRPGRAHRRRVGGAALERADAALYEAKAQGRNRIVVASSVGRVMTPAASAAAPCAARAGRGRRLGHQLRRHQVGAGHLAAAAAGARCASRWRSRRPHCSSPGPPVPWRALAAYGVLIGAGQFGVAVRRDARRHHAGPGLAGDPDAGLLHHRPGDGAGRRARARLPVAGAGAGGRRPGADRAAHRCEHHAARAGAGAAGGAVLGRRQPGGQARRAASTCWASWSGRACSRCRRWRCCRCWFEGPQAIARGLAAAGPGVWAAVLWQSLGNTLFGYGAWAWLLARHPAATVTPMALLVPVFGIGASALLLGEPLPAWKLARRGTGDGRPGAEHALAAYRALSRAGRRPAHLGHSTHMRSGCFMRPACCSARSPQPQK